MTLEFIVVINKKSSFEAGGFNPENTKGEWIGNGESGLNLKLLDKGYLLGYTCDSPYIM